MVWIGLGTVKYYGNVKLPVASGISSVESLLASLVLSLCGCG